MLVAQIKKQETTKIKIKLNIQEFKQLLRGKL
jgi:hypothetical protein